MQRVTSESTSRTTSFAAPRVHFNPSSMNKLLKCSNAQMLNIRWHGFCFCDLVRARDLMES